MRILLIDVNCKNSSTGKIVYDIFQDVQKRGNKAVLCYGRGPLVREKGIYKFGIDWETYMHAGLSRITGYNGCFSRISTKRLIRIIEEFRPDVIHIHELHAYFVNIKLLLEHIKEKKIKLVWTFHCEYMYTGKCGHANDCSNFETECGHCPELHAYPKSLFFDQTKYMFRMKKELLTKMDMVIVCPSNWLADRVRRSFLKMNRIEIIHNGVDADIFHPMDTRLLKEKLKIPQMSKIVITVGADIMSDRKGGYVVQKLAERFGLDVTFILVGSKEKEVVKNKNVIIFPEVSNMEYLAELYTAADIFLLCSQKETFSMTCAEALCCGTRVIGYQCGAPETIFMEPYAVFVEQGDIQSLEIEVKKALKEKWTDEKRITCAGNSQHKYSKNQMTEKYFDLYKEVVY